MRTAPVLKKRWRVWTHSLLFVEQEAGEQPAQDGAGPARESRHPDTEHAVSLTAGINLHTTKEPKHSRTPKVHLGFASDWAAVLTVRFISEEWKEELLVFICLFFMHFIVFKH